jgi:hypothetical protein
MGVEEGEEELPSIRGAMLPVQVCINKERSDDTTCIYNDQIWLAAPSDPTSQSNAALL